MLWTDTFPITIHDLVIHDQDVSTISTAEKIFDIQGVMLASYSKASTELLAASQSYGSANSPFGDSLTGNHIAAVLHTGLDQNVAKIGLAQVVVSSHLRGAYSPLQQWLIYKTLREVYQLAFSRNTAASKYEGKLLLWAGEMERAWNSIWDTGIPVVSVPLPAPGARFLSMGTFGDPQVTTVAQIGATGGQYDVAITWVAGAVESHPSERVTKIIAADNALRVSTSGLTVPSEMIPTETRYSFVPVATATGWNVYVGLPGGTLYRQNPSPIALTTTQYDVTALQLSGTEAGTGQRADWNHRLTRTLFRA